MKIMCYAAVTAAILLMVSQTGLGQAGAPAAAAHAAYSESAPYEPTRFPEPKAKKEAKSKKQKPAEAEPSPAAAKRETHALVEPKPMSIPVSVFDGDGKFVTGLQPSDFKLFVDDQEQQISSVEVRREPLNIILLLDTSPSAAMRVKEMKQYALDLVKMLRSEDKLMVMSFDSKFKVLADLTADREIISKAISKSKMDSGTSLYDTIDDVFRNRLGKIPGRKAIVLFTDGVDTTSRKATYETSLMRAEMGDAPVYPIYWDTSGDIRQLTTRLPFPIPLALGARPQPGYDSQVEAERGRWYLNALTGLSGGRPVMYEAVKSGTQAVSVTILEELQNRYIITFTPLAPQVAGERRKVKVRVSRPNLAVLARGSFIPVDL